MKVVNCILVLLVLNLFNGRNSIILNDRNSIILNDRNSIILNEYNSVSHEVIFPVVYFTTDLSS